MKLLFTTALATAALSLGACQSAMADDGIAAAAPAAAAPTTVGGAAMFPTRTIVQNAVNSPIHRTLVAAVTQAGLVETLNSAGPFTVFAPTDEAFGRVPLATRTALMTDAMKPALTKVLTYHVVPGRITASDLVGRIRAGGGRTTVTTVAGEALTFTMSGDRVMVGGMGGSSAFVTQADVMQSNGVIHVIDGVLLPSM
jgi:uncharacterized surface protein with fasciclin (FAS1) repeats